MNHLKPIKKIIFLTISTVISLNGWSQAVPDTNFVAIPANPSFSFKLDLTNTIAGEISPIDTAYCLAKYPVTNEQYYAFITATGRNAPSYWTGGMYPEGKAKHSVVYVSYTDAQAYCDWLSTKYSGWHFRLPTSAEWENAAKGPNNYDYPWGTTDGTSYVAGVLNTKFSYNAVCANYYLSNYPTAFVTYNNTNSPYYNTQAQINSVISITSTGSVNNWVNHNNYTGFIYTDTFTVVNARGGFTSPVDQYPTGKSYYGCYAMAGNAWTWTCSLDTAKNGGEIGQYVNVVRGGSWYATKPSCKTSFRGEGRIYTGKYNSVGFRVTAIKNTTINGLNFIDKNNDYIGQNFPNPCMGTTEIPIILSGLSNITVTVYDKLGKTIFQINKSNLEMGIHNIKLNTRDLNFTKGLYFYTVEIKNGEKINKQTKKMIII